MGKLSVNLMHIVLVWGLLLLPVSPQLYAADPGPEINSVIESPDTSAFVDELMNTSALKGYASEEMKEFREPIEKQISSTLDNLKAKFKIDVKALLNLLKGRVRVHIDSAKKNVVIYAQPGAGVDISANMDVLKKVLTEERAKFSERSVSGVSVLTVTEGGAPVTFAYTQEKFLLIVSEKDNSVKQIAAFILADLPLFNSTISFAGKYPELAGKGVNGYSGFQFPDVPVPGMNVKAMVETANIPGFSESASRTFVKDDRICSLSFVNQNMKMGLSGMLLSGPVSEETLSWSHESADAVSAVHVELSRLPSVIKEVVTASGNQQVIQGYGMVLPQVKMMTGLDIEQDLFGSLGDEVLFLSFPSGKGGGFPVFSLLGLNSVAAVLKLKNQASFEKSAGVISGLLGQAAGMDRVQGGLRSIDHKGTQIRYIKAFGGALSPCFVIKDGYAVFTLNIPMMRYILDNRGKAPVNGTEEFKATLAQTGVKPGSLFMYQRGISEEEGSAGMNFTNPLAAVAVVGILSSMLLPVLARAREEGRSAACKNNLKQIATACAMYSMSNNEKYPNRLKDLYPDQVSDMMLFKCKSDKRAGLSYILLPGLSSNGPGSAVLAFDRLGNHGGRNVAYLDAHVKFLSEEQFRGTLVQMLNPPFKAGYSPEALKIIQQVLENKMPVAAGGGVAPVPAQPDPLFEEDEWALFAKEELVKIGSSFDFALFPRGDSFPDARKSNFTTIELKENGIYSSGFTGHILRPGGGSSAPVMIAITAIIAAIAIPSLIKSKVAAHEGSAAGSLKTLNGMIYTYRKKGYAGIGRLYPVGNDPTVPNNGKYCGLYFEVNNAEESVTLIGRAEAGADFRSSEDPWSAQGTYIPSIHIQKHVMLPAVTFDRMPKQGYWFALMKYFDDGGKKVPYDKEFSRNHYALVAWPADYGSSGENTYIINEEGTVYQMDRGVGEYLDTYPGYTPFDKGWEIAE